MAKKKRTTKSSTGSRTPTPEPQEPSIVIEEAPTDTAPAQAVAAESPTSEEPQLAACQSNPAETAGVETLNDFALQVTRGGDAASPGEDRIAARQPSQTSVTPIIDDSDKPTGPTQAGCLEANCSGCAVM